MSKFHSLKLFYNFLIFISLLSLIKNDSNEKRRLWDGPSQLNIYLDLFNFNETIPNDVIKNKIDVFINSMNKAKNLLENIFLIDADTAPTASLVIDVDDYKAYMGIAHWNDSMFVNNSKIVVDYYNFFVFFKFETLNNVDMFSKIAFTYADFMPLMGLIIINENILDSKLIPEYLTPLFLQQFIKLLGFHIPYNNGKAQFNGKMEIEEDEISDDQAQLEELKIKSVIIDIIEASNTIEYAQKYFDCDEIEEIELELDEYNNVYWPSRLFLGDIMTKFDNYEEKVISKITLLLLEDTGYLHIINNSYFTGGLMRFGKHKGCEFFSGNCAPYDQLEDIISFSNEFYLPIDTMKYPEPSCSSNRLGKTIYKLHPINTDEGETIVVPASGYNNGEKTGLKQTNYCPFGEYEPTEGFATGFCYDSSTEIDDTIHEEKGQDSFCVLSSLISNNFKAACYKMSCSSMSLTIKVGDVHIVCPQTGGQIQPEGFEGYLLCPDYNLICTGLVLCNNIFDCYEEGSIEKTETLNYDYTIKTTQNSDIYNTDTENLELSEGWELADDGFCPKLCMQCDNDKKCDKCKPGYKIYNDEENKCHEIVPNCKEYNNNDECKICNDDFFLVKEVNETLVCLENSLLDQYYKEDDKDYRIKCDQITSNCLKCSSPGGVCSECKEGFQLIEKNDNTFICVDSSSQLYYSDSDSGKFKLCTEYSSFSNCEKCLINEDNSFTCLQCQANYVFVHRNTEAPSCELKESLIDKYYSEDENNYYPCDSNDYHEIPNCDKCSTKDKCTQCKDTFTTANDGTQCIPNSDIEEKLYYNEPQGSDKYYLCKSSSLLAHCLKCESSSKCIECESNYHIEEFNTCIPQSDIDAKLYYKDDTTNNKYYSCSKISNCEKCSSSTECLSCKSGFNFVENNDNTITCQNIDTKFYYPKNIGDKTYYRLCEKDISYCSGCSDSTQCTECFENYAIIDDNYAECKSLLEQQYYYDTDLRKYKSCSYKFPNCQKCLVENNEFICKECSSDFALRHNNNIECVEKTSLVGNEYFYTNDSEKSYYSCSLYNDVTNCDKCSNKETCNECKSPYRMFNINKLCVLQTDVDNNIYIYNNEGILTPCSSLIKDCNRCSNTTSCYECQGENELFENDTCIQKELVENNNNYFKDNVTNKYISCSIINNCITCESSTKCLSCKDGFNVENDICTEIISNDDNDDNKLKTGAIIGIVFGCLGFFLLVAGALYFFMAKFFKKNGDVDNIIENNMVEVTEGKRENNQEEDARVPENENENKIVVHTNRRSIHNVKN